MSIRNPNNLTRLQSNLLESRVVVEEINIIRNLINEFSDPSIPEAESTEFKLELDEILLNTQNQVALASTIQKTTLENLFLDNDTLLSNLVFLDIILTVLDHVISKSRIPMGQIQSMSELLNQPDLDDKEDISIDNIHSCYYSINNLSKEDIDSYLQEIFKNDTPKIVLNNFVISFENQQSFYENFDDFDNFEGKLNLLAYLGRKYSKLNNNPKTTKKWYSKFITSEKYSSHDNMGLDHKKGKGDHKEYYFKSINLSGDSKKYYFKNRDENTIKSIQVENIYNQIVQGLKQYTNLQVDLDNCNEETKSNYFIILQDLNNVLDTLILNLLNAPRIKKLYNLN